MKLILLALAVGCGVDDLSTTTSALSDPKLLPPVPGLATTPGGYGHYCSITDPTNGGWALGALTSSESDPCGAMARQVGPDAVIQRAGLFANEGMNNVMARCDGGMAMGRAFGAGAVQWIFDQVSKTDKNCIFTIAPTKLPVFGLPFSDKAKATGIGVFDYNYVDTAWDVSEFGMSGTGKACAVDRTGAEMATIGSAGKCNGVSSSAIAAFEPAYDWGMTLDTPILAVADGVIRRSYARDTDKICNNGDQLELFLETQVGTKPYSEHFVAAYHHMNPLPNTADPDIAAHVAAWGNKPMAPDGTVVKKGDVIAYAGTSGCSGTVHLDFMVFRLTNLTGARAYKFDALDTLYDVNGNVISGASGVNGWQGQTDPFGWAAPKNVDPMAYKYIGITTSDQPADIVDAGAWSVNVWDGAVFDTLLHNGADSY